MALTLETRSVSKGVWRHRNQQNPLLTLRVTFLKSVPLAVRLHGRSPGADATRLTRTLAKVTSCDNWGWLGLGPNLYSARIRRALANGVFLARPSREASRGQGFDRRY